jgi:large subunit ribosomal protein L35
MPKMKTHKGAAARFHITGSGKIVRRKIGGSHLRRKKARKVVRSYSSKMVVSNTDTKRIKKFIPYMM